MRRIRARSTGGNDAANANSPADSGDAHYEPPVVIDIGDVRRVTLGSSSSGNADANSQYYW
ncbi:lasso RiPP family leader peptide-containing protein [Actinosynnema sp. NPDC047251]|uniref:lasso RiPP family leader peptide-containing protein n=1 Tax=Saccharothrix espanaensis TaxID=103731 RepID=UPI0011DD5508|nr:lasso RiPP family leader peptide-containing protein [Saccharothrix espanaensis]